MQHVYSLATIYPYATQPNGEIGYHGHIIYTIPKKSKIGGKYGTKIELDYSRIDAIDKQPVSPLVPIDAEATLGYTSEFFKFGEIEYFRDMSIKLSRKLNTNGKYCFHI